ncbi:hypothetical protein Ahy_B05g075650 isoform A [Arachis hypogaea]|uniref:Protein FAR1-RELATED SEQUENCE n=1 Tax=Arachis hypogaea TaxID=3818 RepID=A0A444Z1M9_ARAHY|nr:hypothetical protein Ahy_B05g075650 isoform A [Arachis hypogaea]
MYVSLWSWLKKLSIFPTQKTNFSAGLNCPVISNVILHYSLPCCPNQADMLKQYRQLSIKTYQSFVTAAGDHRESFIEKDVRNYITKKVHNMSELDDAKEIGKYLLRMKEKNQNFFYELELEVDHSIKNIFWADTRSRTICDMNHHGHSTLLGCALMKNKDIQSFKWLFECWLRFMGEKTPKYIFTDQCASMQRAIEICMPITTTIYRCCIWHIMKKNLQKLNDYKRHKEIEQEMSHVVWNSFTKDAFDKNWNDFLMKYGYLVFRSHSICEFVLESEELTAILHCVYDSVLA